jgi:hypothetical protein
MDFVDKKIFFFAARDKNMAPFFVGDSFWDNLAKRHGFSFGF